MNKTFLVIVILVALIGGSLLLFYPIDEQKSSSTYSSDKYSLSFEYPQNYFVALEQGLNGEREQHAIVLAEDTPGVRELFSNPNSATEGPPTITITIFQNNLDNYTLKSFVEGTNFSNFKLSDGNITEIAVGGETAWRYRATGLYENDNVVVARPDYVYMFTAFFNSPDDQILKDFDEILKTVAFTEPGVLGLGEIVAAIKSGNKTNIASFIKFGEFPCTKRDGLGGPPKCKDSEAGGTIVEVLPVIDGEGTHIRKESADLKNIVKPGTYYGQYRVTEEFFSDAYFPKGKHAIIITHDSAPMFIYSILHVTDGKIVRIDGRFGELSLKGLEQIETYTPTSADNAPPGSIHNLPVPDAVAAVKKHVAEKSGVSEGLVIVLTAYEKDWSDGCLGLGGPSESCLFAITPGYEVTVQVKGTEQKYRTNADGSEIRREK